MRNGNNYKPQAAPQIPILPLNSNAFGGMSSVGGNGSDKRVEFVAFFLEFFHERFNGSLGKSFILSALTMAHQTVNDAETCIGGRRCRPDSSRWTALRWRSGGGSGIRRTNHASHGSGHDGATHAWVNDARRHGLTRKDELPAHQGGWVAHIFGHGGDGDGLLRRLRCRWLLLRQVVGRGRRESLRRRERRKLQLAYQKRRGGSGGGRGGNDGTRMAVSGNRRRIQL